MTIAFISVNTSLSDRVEFCFQVVRFCEVSTRLANNVAAAWTWLLHLTNSSRPKVWLPLCWYRLKKWFKRARCAIQVVHEYLTRFKSRPISAKFHGHILGVYVGFNLRRTRVVCCAGTGFPQCTHLERYRSKVGGRLHTEALTNWNCVWSVSDAYNTIEASWEKRKVLQSLGPWPNHSRNSMFLVTSHPCRCEHYAPFLLHNQLSSPRLASGISSIPFNLLALGSTSASANRMETIYSLSWLSRMRSMRRTDLHVIPAGNRNRHAF